jgi:hypothetical protein
MRITVVYAKAAMCCGRAVATGEDQSELENVDVEDPVSLCRTVVLEEVLSNVGHRLPPSFDDIEFAANGRRAWVEVAR